MRIRIDYTVDLDMETIGAIVAKGFELGYKNNGDGDKRNLSIVRRVLADYGKLVLRSDTFFASNHGLLDLEFADDHETDDLD